MSKTIASAVAIVPDDSEMDSHHNGLKRRQSDDGLETEEDSKRRRTTSAGKKSPEEDPLASKKEPSIQPDSPNRATKPAQKEEPSSREPRRKSTIPDDKQRSKRLFGALLGNLNASSQPNDRAVKRRADIEARRKAELAKQDNERLEDKQRRLRELALHRKRKQIFVDEHDMHTLHMNMLDTANMLQTETEPKLYYRPWDLQPDEETRIEEQLAEVRTRIDREVAEFEVKKKKRLAALDGNAPDEESRNEEEPSQPAVTEAVQNTPAKDAHIDSADTELTSKPADPENDSANGEKTAEVAVTNETKAEVDDVKMDEEVKKSDEKHVEAEDDGDHIVEGDEDNVIY